jgi:hypothetical protein
MYKPDILDEIIDQLAPEKIPAEFILMAKIRTYDGAETIVTGPEFEKLMAERGEEIADVRVILDVKKVRTVILTITNSILAESRSL